MTAPRITACVGLSLFAVSGACLALVSGFGSLLVVFLGAVTGVGGGTLRDVLIQRIPSVLRSGLYAIPALLGALVTVGAAELHLYGLPAAIVAAVLCFAVRMLGVHFDLNAPTPRAGPDREPDD